MKDTENYAPFRKGMSHGEKTDRLGTNQYYLHLYQKGEITKSNTKFEAPNEDEAGRKALEICNIEKGNAKWKFVHECSKNRGYEIETPNGTIQLLHILRN